MKDLIFLAHRIPFPPDKGDKIRSFHELEYLSSRYRLHLGAFVDAREDWQHEERLRSFCASTCLLPLSRWQAKLRSLRGLLSGEALTLPFYRDSRMAAWVRSLVRRERPAAALIFSAAMAQYVETLDIPVRALDFVDVDSQKWSQYADMHAGLTRWVYRREAERLLAYERKMARHFDLSLFVSAAEAAVFARLAPEAEERIQVLGNGVDSSYFQASASIANPYPPGRPVLVFTGAMDYWPNIDGVLWFAREVFNIVLRTWPDALFYIVGSHPDASILALREQPGICVTGRVEDVRPYLAHAHLALAPLRVARGIQNKVLEAMSMGRRLVVSPQALEGIGAAEGLDICIAEAAPAWVAGIQQMLSQDEDSIVSNANRDFVLKNYDWSGQLAKLDAYLELAP